jgi:hypothetical protein
MKKIIFAIIMLLSIYSLKAQIYVDGQRVPDNVNYIQVWTHSVTGKTWVKVNFGQIPRVSLSFKYKLTDSLGRKLEFNYLGAIFDYFDQHGWQFVTSFAMEDSDSQTIYFIFKRKKKHSF